MIVFGTLHTTLPLKLTGSMHLEAPEIVSPWRRLLPLRWPFASATFIIMYVNHVGDSALSCRA